MRNVVKDLKESAVYILPTTNKEEVLHALANFILEPKSVIIKLEVVNGLNFNEISI